MTAIDATNTAPATSDGPVMSEEALAVIRYEQRRGPGMLMWVFLSLLIAFLCCPVCVCLLALLSLKGE